MKSAVRASSSSAVRPRPSAAAPTAASTPSAKVGRGGRAPCRGAQARRRRTAPRPCRCRRRRSRPRSGRRPVRSSRAFLLPAAILRGRRANASRRWVDTGRGWCIERVCHASTWTSTTRLAQRSCAAIAWRRSRRRSTTRCASLQRSRLARTMSDGCAERDGRAIWTRCGPAASRDPDRYLHLDRVPRNTGSPICIPIDTVLGGGNWRWRRAAGKGSIQAGNKACKTRATGGEQ